MHVEHHTSTVRRATAVQGHMVWLSVPVRLCVGMCVMSITNHKHRTDVFLIAKQRKQGHACMCGGWTKAQVYQFNTSLLQASISNATHTISCSHFRLICCSFPLSFTNTHTLTEGWSPGRRSQTEKNLKMKFSVFMSLFSSDIEICLFASFKQSF